MKKQFILGNIYQIMGNGFGTFDPVTVTQKSIGFIWYQGWMWRDLPTDRHVQSNTLLQL